MNVEIKRNRQIRKNRATALETGGGDEDDPVVVVLAADENFALPLSVALYSITHQFTSGRELHIYVFDAGLGDGTKERLERVVARGSTDARVTFRWIQPETSGLDVIDRDLDSRYNTSTFYRLLIPEILTGVTKVIYLDCDVVLHDDITALWEEDLDGVPVRAVPERTVSCPVAGIAEWETLGLDPKTPFFNSGVLVMDLDLWRDREIHTRTIEYLADPTNRFVRVGDQEALNAVLFGRWAPLDPRWNALFYFPDTVVRDAHLSHFAGAHPWLADWRHPAAPRFVENLRQTGWFSPATFSLWMLRVHAQRTLHRMKAITRPLRHRLGIRRLHG